MCTQPNRGKVLYFTQKGQKNLLMHSKLHSGKVAAQFHITCSQNQTNTPRLHSNSYIFHPYLQFFFFSKRDSLKTWPYNHGLLWSHLTIILDTKSTALTGTGCQIKPFNDKFSPKVSWEISSGLHCGKKALNLTLNLNRLFFFFFCLRAPKLWPYPRASQLSYKSNENIPNSETLI